MAGVGARKELCPCFRNKKTIRQEVMLGQPDLSKMEQRLKEYEMVMK